MSQHFSKILQDQIDNLLEEEMHINESSKRTDNSTRVHTESANVEISDQVNNQKSERFNRSRLVEQRLGSLFSKYKHADTAEQTEEVIVEPEVNIHTNETVNRISEIISSHLERDDKKVSEDFIDSSSQIDNRITSLQMQINSVSSVIRGLSEQTMVSGIGQGGDGQTPGSGEVILSRMDDVNADNVKPGYTLIWNGSEWAARPGSGARPPIYDGTDNVPIEHPDFTPGSTEAELVQFDIWIDSRGTLHYYYDDQWNDVTVFTEDVLPGDGKPAIITPNGETFINQNEFNEWLYTRTDRRPIISLNPPTIHPDFPADPLRVGDFWIASTDSKLYYYDGTVWEPIAGSSGRPPIFSPTPPTLHPDFTAPDDALEIGDIWYDSDDDFKQYLYDGTSWVHPEPDRLEAFTRFYEVVDSASYNSGNNGTMSFGIADGANLNTVTNIKLSGTDATDKIRYKYEQFDKLIVEDERNGAYAQFRITVVNSIGDYDVLYERGNGVTAADYGQTFAIDRDPDDDGIIVSDTAPTQVTNGNLWFDSSDDSLVLFVYYDPNNDPNTAAWVPASPPVSLDGINATIDTALIVQDTILERLESGETTQSTLQADLANRVAKSGDTMAGSLILSSEGQPNDDNVRLYMKDNLNNTNFTLFPTGNITSSGGIRFTPQKSDSFDDRYNSKVRVDSPVGWTATDGDFGFYVDISRANTQYNRFVVGGRSGREKAFEVYDDGQGRMRVYGKGIFDGSCDIGGSLTVDGDTDFKGDVIFEDDATFNTQVTAEDVKVNDNLIVDGSANFKADVTFEDVVTFDKKITTEDVKVNGLLDVSTASHSNNCALPKSYFSGVLKEFNSQFRSIYINHGTNGTSDPPIQIKASSSAGSLIELLNSSNQARFGINVHNSYMYGGTSSSPWVATSNHHFTTKKYVDDQVNAVDSKVQSSSGPTGMWFKYGGDSENLTQGRFILNGNRLIFDTYNDDALLWMGGVTSEDSEVAIWSHVSFYRQSGGLYILDYMYQLEKMRVGTSFNGRRSLNFTKIYRKYGSGLPTVGTRYLVSCGGFF